MLHAQFAALASGAEGGQVCAAAVAAFGGADAAESTGRLWLLQSRVMNTLAGLALPGASPRAPDADAVLDAAQLAAAGAAELIGFRRDAVLGADEDTVLAGLTQAATSLQRALEGVEELLALAEALRRAGTGRDERGAALLGASGSGPDLRTGLSCPGGRAGGRPRSPAVGYDDPRDCGVRGFP